MEFLQTLKVGSVAQFILSDIAVISVSVSGVVTVSLAGGVCTITAVAVGACVVVFSRTDGSFTWRPVTVTV